MTSTKTSYYCTCTTTSTSGCSCDYTCTDIGYDSVQTYRTNTVSDEDYTQQLLKNILKQAEQERATHLFRVAHIQIGTRHRLQFANRKRLQLQIPACRKILPRALHKASMHSRIKEN